ncbi:MAG: hypothetical protein JSU74_09265 [Candidatus Zixiibacteriota bacterium]|nr:MAG: hypothetical protein JSU74_09265 [candidate division Zixibacteria bacterium]
MKSPGLFTCQLLIATLAASVIGINPYLSAAKDVPKVPFLIERNRVIIPTSVNGSEPLNLILDTGMRFDGVYLFHKNLANVIDTTGAIEVRVPGAGAGEASTAIMIETGQLGFGEVTVDSQRVLIGQSAHTQQFLTDGIIGWNLFGHYIVKIDYDQQVILLHDTSYVPEATDWHEIPIELRKDLPFLEAKVEVVEGEEVSILCYIDLASGDALELLVKPEQKFTLPATLVPRNLGTGLSGDINGHSGYSYKLSLGPYDLHNVATAFAPAEVRSKQEGADGILGNDSIRRFNVIFDYPHQRLLIKPNKAFDTPFE